MLKNIMMTDDLCIKGEKMEDQGKEKFISTHIREYTSHLIRGIYYEP